MLDGPTGLTSSQRDFEVILLTDSFTRGSDMYCNILSQGADY